MAARAKVARLMTFVVVTMPTFWLNEAVGKKPRTEPKMLVAPKPKMAPWSSSDVGWRFMAPDVVAEKSPMAWIELMTNRIEMAIQAAG